jgi:sulfate permease, SulP family
MHRMLQRRGIALVLDHVNEQPLSLMRRSGFEALIGADAIVPNIEQAAAQFGA